MADRTVSERLWWWMSAGLAVAIAVVDLLAPPHQVFFGLLVVPPLLAAVRCRPAAVAGVAVLALALAILLGPNNRIWLTADHLIRTATVLVTGAIAVGAAVMRQRAERSLRVSTDEQRAAEAARTATYRISEAAHTAVTLEEVFAAVHHIVADLMPARNFYIALHDPTTDVITFPYFVDEVDAPPAPKRPGRGLTEYVLRTGRHLLVTPEVQDALERAGETELTGAPSIDWLGVPLADGGTPFGVLAVQSYTPGIRYSARDVAVLQFVSTQVAAAIERKRSEALLRDSEERYRHLVELAPDAIFVHAGGRFVYVNPAGVRLLGAAAASELLGRQILDFVHPEFRDVVRDRVRSLGDGAASVPAIHERFVRLDDTVVDVEVQAGPMVYEGRPAVQVLVRDITERRRTEERLVVQAAALDAAANSILIMDRQGRIEWANPALLALTGYSLDDLVGQPPRLLRGAEHDARHAGRMWATLRGGGVWSGELSNRRLDGSRYDVDLTITPLRDEEGAVTRFVAVGQDVTAQRRLEDRLRQSQKMEAIGELAGGVAHDFNNLLTAVLASSELLAELLQHEPRYHEDLLTIRSAAERGSDLTRKLLAFSRRQPLALRTANLASLVQDFARIARRLVPEDVDLQLSISAPDALVKADAGAVEQILMNLVTNARDALPGGGRVTVEVRHGAPDDLPSDEPEIGEGFVVLAVHDTGSGMDEETQRRIFEPFFTTKPVDRGTGLGMAVVYGLAKQHRGFVRVTSAPGAGTLVRIGLPLAGPAGAAPVPAVPAQPGGSETILLVEDDADVRRTASRALARFGYAVHTASDGEEALAVLERLVPPPDLIVSDVVMPRMSGPALLRALRDRGVTVPVLFTSGHPARDVRERTELDPDVPFLPKPWTVVELLLAVRHALRPPPTGEPG